MLTRLAHSLISFFAKFTNNKITCYHCGEKSRPSITVYVRFDGEIRAVCCYGCAAILKTVEELGMHDEYKSHKIQATPPQ